MKGEALNIFLGPISGKQKLISIIIGFAIVILYYFIR